MNKERRAKIRKIVPNVEKTIDSIQVICDSICDIKDDEIDAMLNMPENLQSSERYSNMELTVDDMQDILDKMYDIIDELHNTSNILYKISD